MPTSIVVTAVVVAGRVVDVRDVVLAVTGSVVVGAEDLERPDELHIVVATAKATTPRAAATWDRLPDTDVRPPRPPVVDARGRHWRLRPRASAGAARG